LRTILAVALVLVLTIAAVLVFYPPSIRVKVLDPRFHVLSVKILRGTNDTFYMGNQLEGHVREFLQKRLHLNVKLLHNLGPLMVDQDSRERKHDLELAALDEVNHRYYNGLRPPWDYDAMGNNYRLAIVFTWNASQAPPRFVVAELVDSSGRITHLSGNITHLGGIIGGQSNPHLCSWGLGSGRKVGDFHLRLRGATPEFPNHVNEPNLVDVEIRGLPPLAPQR
jgi:hypothetical protein